MEKPVGILEFARKDETGLKPISNWMKTEPPKFTPETRSEEHGSWIIEALETGRNYRGHFNGIYEMMESYLIYRTKR